MSVDPIGSQRTAAGLDGVERLTGKSASRGVEAQSADFDSLAPLAASELRPYLAAGRTTSAGREERVAALRAAVAQGSYQVPIDTLAKKLLGNGN